SRSPHDTSYIDGTEKWNFSTESYVLSTPAIDENGTIYFGSFDGNVSALDPDGTEKWSYQTDGPVVSSPAITDSGRIYVASYNGTLYAQQ
ncbi:MAG: PQQ-binding-like beta-propeller repeat protein, partial [Thermoplasmata archaeon]